jgi:hypothetical protein
VVAWGLGAGGMYVALWPAMWVDPVAVFGDVVTFARTVGGQPHDWSNFFLGEAITQDPGPAFYLIALAFRLGPVALVGLLALAVVATIWRRLERPTAALAIALYVLGFVLLMTLGGKKFDRYMLPAIVMLDLLAGAGVWEVARRLGRRQVRVALVAGAIAVQAAFCWRAYPYPLAAYNPLLGGASQAQRVMLIGWGEGLDQVAAFLNSRPDADTLVVTTLYHEALRPHVLGRTIRIGEAVPLDYFVVYVNMAQRQLVPNSVRRLIEQNPPVFTARVGGQPYAWVYRVPPGVRVPALERPAEGAADDTAPRPGRP